MQPGLFRLGGICFLPLAGGAPYTEGGAHGVPLWGTPAGLRPRRVPAQPERAPPRSRSPASFVKPGAGFRAGRFDPAERKASNPETSAVKKLLILWRSRHIMLLLN